MVGLDFNSLEDYISALTTKDPNKLRVYLDNMDGHALRAYSYWPDSFPDIKQVDPNVKCYSAKVGDTDICFTEDDDINYLGSIYKGKDFYELFTSGKL